MRAWSVEAIAHVAEPLPEDTAEQQIDHTPRLQPSTPRRPEGVPVVVMLNSAPCIRVHQPSEPIARSNVYFTRRVIVRLDFELLQRIDGVPDRDVVLKTVWNLRLHRSETHSARSAGL